jgi:hypothetical protein
MANGISVNQTPYSNKPGFLTSAEKASPLGYYFAFLIIFLVGGIYSLVEFGGIVSDKSMLLITISDALLVVGTLMFLMTSLFGYIKSKNLRIQDAMFGFSMASLSFCVAGFIWTWYNLILQVRAPFPSMADVFFLIGSLATIAAIYSASKAIKETTGLKVELNVIIIVLAVVATAAIVGTYPEGRHDARGVHIHRLSGVRYHLPGPGGEPDRALPGPERVRIAARHRDRDADPVGIPHLLLGHELHGLFPV